MSIWNTASEEVHINPDEKQEEKASKNDNKKRYQCMTRIENVSYRANGETFFQQFSEKTQNMLTSEKNVILSYGKDNKLPSSKYGN